MRSPIIVTALFALGFLGPALPAAAQGTGDYAASIPAEDVRAGEARRDALRERRSLITTEAAVHARHHVERHREPGKKTAD